MRKKGPDARELPDVAQKPHITATRTAGGHGLLHPLKTVTFLSGCEVSTIVPRNPATRNAFQLLFGELGARFLGNSQDLFGRLCRPYPSLLVFGQLVEILGLIAIAL